VGDIQNYKGQTTLVATTSPSDSENHKQALSGLDSWKWKEAEPKEVNKMLKHEFWIQCQRAPDDSPIPATRAFRKKLGDKNQVIKPKSRICAQGF
jgi:hypothetical protein